MLNIMTSRTTAYLKRYVENFVLGDTIRKSCMKESMWQGFSNQMSCLVASLNPISMPNTKPNRPSRLFLPVLRIYKMSRTKINQI